VERREPGYSTDAYTGWACDFLRGRKRDDAKPWFLWLCWGAIHGPTTPAKRHIGKHKNDEIRVPEDILGPRPGKPDYLEKTQAWQRGEDGRIYARRAAVAKAAKQGKAPKGPGQSYDDWVRQSNDCVEALDEGVGRILETLRETGQLDNTLIIFTADQGFGMGEHGFRIKLAPYDATYRSPMLVSMPSSLPRAPSAASRSTRRMSWPPSWLPPGSPRHGRCTGTTSCRS
jgi:arylsulfatase A-like enzyme